MNEKNNISRRINGPLIESILLPIVIVGTHEREVELTTQEFGACILHVKRKKKKLFETLNTQPGLSTFEQSLHNRYGKCYCSSLIPERRKIDPVSPKLLRTHKEKLYEYHHSDETRAIDRSVSIPNQSIRVPERDSFCTRSIQIAHRRRPSECQYQSLNWSIKNDRSPHSARSLIEGRVAARVCAWHGETAFSNCQPYGEIRKSSRLQTADAVLTHREIIIRQFIDNNLIRRTISDDREFVITGLANLFTSHSLFPVRVAIERVK